MDGDQGCLAVLQVGHSGVVKGCLISTGGLIKRSCNQRAAIGENHKNDIILCPTTWQKLPMVILGPGIWTPHTPKALSGHIASPDLDCESLTLGLAMDWAKKATC